MATMKQFMYRALFLLLLVFTAGTAWAADYVITYNGNFLGYSGSALQNYTTFNPATCIWEGTSGGKLKLKGGTGNCYLRYNNGLTNSSQTNGSNWTISDEGYMSCSSGYYTYYIYLNGSTWAASRNNYGSTRGVAELVTTTTVADGVSVNPINGQTAINAVGSYDYTTTAKYNDAYTNYSWNSGSFDTSHTETDVTIFAWTLSPATTGVQINSSTGVLSVTSLPTNTTAVTLTATATSNGRTGTATKTVKILGTTPSAPKISNYKETVTITAEGSIDKIYYTTDGTTPTTSSTLYTGPFTVSGTPTIKAIAVRGEALSSVTSHTVINPTTGVSSDGTTVTMMDWEDIDNWTYYTGVSDDVDGGNYNNNYKGILFSPGARNIIIEYRGGSVDKASPVAISAESGENQDKMVYYQTVEQGAAEGEYPYTVIPNPFSKRPAITNADNTKTYYGFNGWKLIDGDTYVKNKSKNAVLALDEDITFENIPEGTHPRIIFEATWVPATVRTGTSAQSFTGGTYETNFWVLDGGARNNAFSNINQNMTISARYPDGTISTSNASSRAISLGTSFTGTVKFEWVSIGGVAVDASGRNLFFGRGVNNGSGGALTFVNANTTVDQNVRIESGQFTTLRHYGASITTSGNHKKQHVVLGCDYDRAKGINTNLQFSSTMYLASGTSITGKNSGDELARTIVKSGNFNTTGQNDIQGNPADAYYYGCSVSGYQKGYRYLEIQGGVWPTIIGGVDQTNDVDKLSFELRMKGGLVKGAIYGAAQKDGCSGTRIMVLTGGTIRGWIAGGANGTANSGAQMTGETFVYVGGNTKVVSATDANEQIPSSSLLNRAVGGNVFGAGCGYNASLSVGEVTLGTNVVVADNSTIERGVYGGGSYGFTTQTSNIYITGGHVLGKMGGVQVSGTNSTPSYSSSIHGGVYGGACQNKGGTANIFMTGGVVEGGVYGGSNASGTLNGSANIKIVGGKVGLNATTLAHICGGGYGNATRVTQNVDVIIGDETNHTGPTIYGDVYGGSEQGLVNTNANSDTYQPGKHVNVTVNGGTINGDVYGGGLGTSSNAANTYGETAVTVSGGEINGRVFGCNNVNGRPFDTSVTVDITGGTIHSTSEDTSMGSVYGGGNQAQYAGSPTVTLNGADAECDNIFGGGLAAQVNGDPKVQIQNGTVNKDVYGGGALAIVQGNTNVQMSGGHVKRNVYGGGLGDASTAANITRTGVNTGGNTEVLVSGGSVDQAVFGGNNVNGTPAGAISVTVTGSDTPTGDNKYTIGAVFGGGNKANYNGKPVVTISGGYVGEAFGGAREANVTNTDITVSGGTIGSVYGGGYGPVVDGTPTNAEITDATGGTSVKIRGGKITSIFGGSNQRGDIAGTIGLDINWDADKAATASINSIYGGGRNAPYPKPVADSPASKDITVALQRATANYVFGGGLGESAVVTGNTSVIINDNNAKVQQEVYGGGALGDVTADTKVILKGGSVNNVYGGGLGSSEVAAKVGGNTLIELNKPTNANNDDTYGTCVVNGSIFGANNVNGTPEGNTDVKIYKTVARTGQTAGQYDVAEVYGGGNLAAYVPTAADATTNVTVMNCNNSIEYVYGGGNAAPVPATNVTIWGAREIANVFGGGNGYGASNPGANVGYNNISNNTSNPYGAGTTQVNVYGGTVNSIFGGSNTKGLIAQSANVNVTADPQETMPDACTTCALQLNEVYGSGNEAEMFCAANMDLGCIPGVKQVYGGAKNANVGTATSPVEVTLNITSGKFEKVFGGNNLGGDIYGFITVNVDETGCFPVEIDELYGCGNQAAYDMTKIKKAGETVNGETVTYGAGVVWHDPTVNVYSASRIGSVFGGGLGTAAVVTGNPIVNIMQIPGKYNPAATASATANTTTLNNDSKLGGITGAIYGGGNLAKVIGNTTVNIANVSEATRPNGNAITNIGANIKGNVYGGGNLADVTGKTTVNVGKK